MSVQITHALPLFGMKLNDRQAGHRFWGRLFQSKDLESMGLKKSEDHKPPKARERHQMVCHYF